jgi:hypothetical protein
MLASFPHNERTSWDNGAFRNGTRDDPTVQPKSTPAVAALREYDSSEHSVAAWFGKQDPVSIWFGKLIMN